ncbi:MAG: TadE/TadG family type IV pilus assembly protein [Candidatus Dormiibacterota bacterium]
MSHWHWGDGQALVELAVVLPVLLVLGCGAVAVVQIARTQLAMETAASATALVAARAMDATQACSGAHQEMATVLTESNGLLPLNLTDALRGGCVGPLPQSKSLIADIGTGSFALWIGYGGPNDTFCRVGSGPGTPTDGDVVATVVYRPDLAWIPLIGSWLSPRLSALATDKVDPFRSRDPSIDPTGDDC